MKRFHEENQPIEEDFNPWDEKDNYVLENDLDYEE